jgi:putative hydroxymethylpyrimidine transport system permease protein
MNEAPPVPRLGPARRGIRPRGYLLSLAIVVAAVVAWQGATVLLHLESWLLPTPGQVAATFTQPDTQALIGENVWPTVEEALAGFAVCVVAGVGLAVAMAASRVVRDGLYPLLIASQAIPTIAIAAVLVVAFGYGLAPKVVVVALFSFFAITVNVYDALQTLDPALPGLLRTLGASRWDVVRTARLPAALPGFFTGAKLAITYSVSAAVYSEWVGTTDGLGYALLQAKNQYAEAQVFAIVLVMAALGLAGFALVALLERLVVPWSRPAQAERSL